MGGHYGLRTGHKMRCRVSLFLESMATFLFQGVIGCPSLSFPMALEWSLAPSCNPTCQLLNKLLKDA